jgi:hypothetical protein
MANQNLKSYPRIASIAGWHRYTDVYSTQSVGALRAQGRGGG